MFKTACSLGGVLVVATLMGCPKPATTAGAGQPTSGAMPVGTPAAAAGPAFGGTMADATLYHTGATIKAAPPCGRDGSGYAKFDFPVGQALKMDVTVEGPAGTCLSIHYLKANGGAVDGMMKELCVDKNAHETWDIQGLEGGSFIQVSEAVPCKGATLTVAVQ